MTGQLGSVDGRRATATARLVATDDPGFAADESLATLGEALKLPRFLEPRRGEIEAVLPALA